MSRSIPSAKPRTTFNSKETRTMIRKPIAQAVAAIALTAAAASPAVADTVTLSGWYFGSPSPEAVSVSIPSGEDVTYPLGGPTYTAPLYSGPNAGAFKASWGPLVNFETYCTDLFHGLTLPGTYANYTLTSAATYLGAQKAHDLGSLWNLAHGGVIASNTDSYQLAVWEIVNEDSGNPYSLATGALRSSSAAAGKANTWLALVNGAASDGKIYNVQMLVHNPGLHGTKVQDLLLPVPEPETYAMFLAGLGMMGFVARRRARRV